MSSVVINFEQKRKIKSKLTVPTWLYNLSLVAYAGDEKGLKKIIKRLAIQAVVLEVECVSFFVQQQLLAACLSHAQDVVAGAIPAPELVVDMMTTLLQTFTKGEASCS